MSTDQPSAQGQPDPADTEAALRARLELLTEENRRLRRAYGAIRRTRHRRTALGLAAVGGVALVAGAVFPAARQVLVVLAAIGLFGGLLTWYVTPERFVAAEVGERVYAALAANEDAIATALGLAETGRYVPVPDDPIREAALYLPQTEGGPIPDPESLSEVFVAPDDPERRGLSLQPTGGPLLAELRRATTGELATDPASLVEQLVDGLVEQFELVESARPEVDTEGGRVSVAVDGSAYGDVDRFDHPVASVLATGLAVGLGTPTELTVEPTPDGRGEYLLTVRWNKGPSDG